MTIIRSKGTVFQREIASVYTAVAQCIGIDLPDAESETFEADTLDNANAGIPYKPTGRSEGGSCGVELFLDPALSGHRQYTADINAPTTRLPCNHKVIFADAANTEWPFAVAGVGLGGTVALADGLKANLTLKLDGTVTYPAPA